MKGGNFGGKDQYKDNEEEAKTNGVTLDDISSPIDSAVDMKKKRRLI